MNMKISRCVSRYVFKEIKLETEALTGDGDVPIGLSLVDDVHDLFRTGHEAFSAALTAHTSLGLIESLITVSLNKGVVINHLHVRDTVLILMHSQIGLCD